MTTPQQAQFERLILSKNIKVGSQLSAQILAMKQYAAMGGSQEEISDSMAILKSNMVTRICASSKPVYLSTLKPAMLQTELVREVTADTPANWFEQCLASLVADGLVEVSEDDKRVWRVSK